MGWRLLVEEDGQALVEYGLLVVLVSAAWLATISALGVRPREVYVTINERMHCDAL
jgi:Flp pilus assembly pilin Flp